MTSFVSYSIPFCLDRSRWSSVQMHSMLNTESTEVHRILVSFCISKHCKAMADVSSSPSKQRFFSLMSIGLGLSLPIEPEYLGLNHADHMAVIMALPFRRHTMPCVWTMHWFRDYVIQIWKAGTKGWLIWQHLTLEWGLQSADDWHSYKARSDHLMILLLKPRPMGTLSNECHAAAAVRPLPVTTFALSSSSS